MEIVNIPDILCPDIPYIPEIPPIREVTKIPDIPNLQSSKIWKSSLKNYLSYSYLKKMCKLVTAKQEKKKEEDKPQFRVIIHFG